MPAVSREQLLLSLSLIAYAGSTGEAVHGGAALRRTIDDWLTRCASTRGLRLHWGPASFRVWWQPSMPALVAFVVAAPETGECTLVVRGGGPMTLWDQSLESLSCLEQEPWSWAGDVEGLAPAICSGVHRLLAALCELTPEEQVAGAGRTLHEFFAEAISSASPDRRFSIRVTGHGVGGALATAAALWLFDTQGEGWGREPSWDPQRRAKVHCCAFACPTLGNSDFVTYLGERLGAELEHFFNRLDHVPALWDPQAMLELPELYKPHVREPGLLRAMLETISTEIERQGIEYEQPPAQLLEGRLNTALPPSFMAQAEYQHLHAYASLLGVDEILDVDAILERRSGTDDGPIAQ